MAAATDSKKIILTARLAPRPMDRQYMNSREMCICCFGTLGDGDDLTVHHVRYFPELCCYVHAKCHEDIHRTPSVHPYLIQYEEGDSIKFYETRMAGSDLMGGRGRGRSRRRGGRGRRDGGRRPADGDFGGRRAPYRRQHER